MNGAGNRIILFFTPEAGVTPHFTAQCVLARTLKEQGENVRFAFCPGLFSRCPVMDMHGLPADVPSDQRKRVCGDCMQNARAILNAYGLPAISLADHLDHQSVLEVASLGQSMPPDMRDFVYDGIPFGKICLHDLVLATKLNDHENISPEHRRLWIQFTTSAVLSYLMTRRLCQDLDVAAVVTYQDYGILLGARLAAEARGIRAFTTHAAWHRSVDRRHVVIVPEIEFRSRHAASQRWPEWKPLPLSPADVGEVGDDLLRKFGGGASHTYSPPKTFDQTNNLLRTLNLSPDKKLVVAYTSSTDEYLAAKVMKGVFGIPGGGPEQPFTDQLDWIGQLITHFETRDDVQLVVRIHPREGANQRENFRSQHLQQLHDRFDGSHRNCLIIWPEEKVSSYDLAELASLVLTSWSSMGMEMARLGLPVLAAFKGYQYWPHEPFLEWAPTSAAYFEKLHALLQQPPSFDDVRSAFRWYHQDALGRAVDLGDIIPDPDFGGLPPFKLPRAASAIREIIVDGRSIVDINLQRRRQSAAEPGAEAREREALQRQLRRLVHFLCTGKEPPQDFPLAFVEADVRTDDDVTALIDRVRAAGVGPTAHLFVAGPQRDLYIAGPDLTARRSPMAARLARAGAQSTVQPVPVAGPVPTLDDIASAAAVLARAESLWTAGDRREARVVCQRFLTDRFWDPRVVEALVVLASVAPNER